MYDHILVAVSLEEGVGSSDSVAVARALANDGAKITAFHVIEELPTYVTNQIPSDLLANRKPEAESRLRDELGEAADVQPLVVYGHAGQAIVSFAESDGVDCIVIASHQPGLQDIFLGSTAQRVVRQAHCAVHVLR